MLILTMAIALTIGASLISFFLTLFVLPRWIRRAKSRGLVGIDVHKRNKKKVAELGGLITIGSAILGLLVYVAGLVFLYKTKNSTMIYLFAAACSLLLAMLIGLVDDILGWKIGLRQKQKMLLSVVIAVPLMVIRAGHTVMSFPWFGFMDVGIWYVLAFIPLGIVFAANAFNMLAGFNGLEAGMGIIILTTLGILSFGRSTAAVLIAFCLVASLLAFFIFNRYPSRVFPGDTLTYPIGAGIAIVAILGNIEKFGAILFIPYILEFFLKLRGKMQKESFGRLQRDGSITNRYSKWYSLTHVAIAFLRKAKGKAYERQVVYTLLSGQLLIAIVTVLYFFF